MFGSYLLPIVVLAVLAFYILGIYNTLAKIRVRIKEAWSQIDVQLKKRADLVPALIKVVKG